MDSTGRIHVFDDELPTATANFGNAEPIRHSGFVTRDPMPERCNARKVLAALDKLADRACSEIPYSDAALLPLDPFERGYVLGVLAEYRAWKAGQ